MTGVAAYSPQAVRRWRALPLHGGGPAATPTLTCTNEVSGLAPGRALDVGAGEGGDALWLAEQGWRVTANDISQRALDRTAAQAERRALPVECHHADANAFNAFQTGAYDLVSVQYA